MKKIIMAFAAFLLLSVSAIPVCYAGDVPEALLNSDGAVLYFGRVVDRSDDSVTILPVFKIKGDVTLNAEITYTKGYMVRSGGARVGRTYLIGSVNEYDLNYWVTDGMDPKTLKIKNAYAMDLRLQQYLNNGDFEKAEQARLDKIKGKAASPSASPTVAPTPAPAGSPALSSTDEHSSLPVSSGATVLPSSNMKSHVFIFIAAIVVITVLMG